MSFECDLCGIEFEDGDLFVNEDLRRIRRNSDTMFTFDTVSIPEMNARVCLDCAEDR